jgi:predicted O-methyltransferase YrrM
MKDLFDKHIQPILEVKKPKTLMEIGVLKGGVTIKSLEYCKEFDAKLTSIEPVAWSGKIPEEIKPAAPGFDSSILGNAIVPEYVEKIYEIGLETNWNCIKSTSLQYLSSTDYKGFDCYLIDGDHNYFTLYNELSQLHRKTKPGDIIFMHDVGKWGRLDQYYNESNIPLEYLYSKKQGLLTAIEDFVKASTHTIYRRWRNHRIPFYRTKKQTWRYKTVTLEQYGLGMLERL